jgi:hypothetical protein
LKLNSIHCHGPDLPVVTEFRISPAGLTRCAQLTIVANQDQESFARTKEQIVARLRHPSGQLALLNPPRDTDPATPLHPVVLHATNSVFMTALWVPRDSANRHRLS